MTELSRKGDPMAYPYLPLFTDSFIADTTHLSTSESGAYLLLLMMAWRSPGCRLPDDDAKLSRWARTDKRTWLKMKPAVMAFWDLADGFWTQRRLTKEWEFTSKRSDVNRKNGAGGGRPKTLKLNEPENPAGSVRVSETKAPNPIPIASAKAEAARDAAAPPAISEIRQPIQAMVDRLFAQFPAFAAAGANAGLLDTSPILRLVAAEDCDLALDVEATIAGILARGRTPRTWSYFAGPIREARDARRAAPPKAAVSRPEFGGFAKAKNYPDGQRIPDADGRIVVWVQRFGGWDQLEPDHPDMTPFWKKALEAYQRGEEWPEHHLGMPPGHPHCLVPAEGLAWLARRTAATSGAESTARH